MMAGFDSGKSVSDLFSHGFSCYQNGRLDEALEICTGLLKAEPDHAAALLVCGVICAQRGRFAEAVLHCETLVRLRPDYPDARYYLGKSLQGLGRVSEAIGHYEQALRLRPDYIDVLAALGELALLEGRADEAIAHYRHALGLRPEHPGLDAALGAIFADRNRPEEAKTHYARAIVLDPADAESHIRLGAIFSAQGNLRDAAQNYAQAASLRPDAVAPLNNLGGIFARAEQYDRAAELYKRALAIDPSDSIAGWNIISVLESASRLQEADIYRKAAPKPKPVGVEAAAEHRRTVLVLWNNGSGNIPSNTIIPPSVNTRLNWCADLATDEQEEALPAFDIVFNGVGNAEHVEPSLARISHFRRRCRRPFLNPPERVAPTRRDRMPGLLGDIPGVVVPPVMRFGRDEVKTALAAKLAAGGVHCPLLARPVSGQGGSGVILAQNPDDLEKIVFPAADAFYFIAYHDYRSPDGYFRKYRTIFVDRRPYPYHLAISPRWLVHYDTADMLAAPEKREEERRFLEAPDLALGPVAFAAIEAIGRRLDLDYAGIDYSVLPDGRLLVFEANATMSVVAPDPDLYPYKQAPVRAIYAAFEDMLERRTAPP